MKRKDVIRRITELGAVFEREGAEHSIYRNPRTGQLVPVPRHAEINEITTKKRRLEKVGTGACDGVLRSPGPWHSRHPCHREMP